MGEGADRQGDAEGGDCRRVCEDGEVDVVCVGPVRCVDGRYEQVMEMSKKLETRMDTLNEAIQGFSICWTQQGLEFNLVHTQSLSTDRGNLRLVAPLL